jgi:Tfp pilus assembly protein PilX
LLAAGDAREILQAQHEDKVMTNKHRNQRGVALILAMFALIVVTSIALGMMYLADTETSVDSNFRDEQLSYYAAHAGLEEARDRMRTTAGTGINHQREPAHSQTRCGRRRALHH